MMHNENAWTLMEATAVLAYTKGLNSAREDGWRAVAMMISRFKWKCYKPNACEEVATFCTRTDGRECMYRKESGFYRDIMAEVPQQFKPKGD